ncbi:RidA family protein [Sphingomonas sp. SM33]|uniref:RidA family protein n=1 Tax=Sphingomonas telluris TaxID=2907998 RepID=A0ABS9VNT7_9SPHN|nr:RidA family protein [Sphingomonas telluris]
MAHLSQFVVADEFVFFSGQIGFEAPGVLVEGGITSQAQQIFRNLDVYLAELGMTRETVVKTTIWITDAQNFEAANEAYAQYFGDHRPARSTTVAGLVLEGALIEIEFVAKKPSEKR